MAGRSRRIAWAAGCAVVAVVAAFVWALIADLPPSPVWVLDVAPAGTSETASCDGPDGVPLPGGWFVYRTPEDNENPYHMHRNDPPDAGRVHQFMQRLLGRESRGFACASYTPTGRERAIRSGRWIEIERSGPVH